MKKSILYYSILMALIVSCSGSNSPVDSERLMNAVTDVSDLESWKEHNPIEVFLALATKGADESISLNKANINLSLEKAKSFEHCIIVVDNHTLVSIKDLSNCQQSGSWETCMPYAEGYVQRGELREEADFLNNIIGKPDLQQRMMFLFDEKQ